MSFKKRQSMPSMHSNPQSALLYAFARVLTDGSTVRLECRHHIETDCHYWMGFRDNKQSTHLSSNPAIVCEELVPQEETEARNWFEAMVNQKSVTYLVKGYYCGSEGDVPWEQTVKALSVTEAKGKALFNERCELLDLKWDSVAGEQIARQMPEENEDDALAEFLAIYKGEMKVVDRSFYDGDSLRVITEVGIAKLMIAAAPVEELANILDSRIKSDSENISKADLEKFVRELKRRTKVQSVTELNAGIEFRFEFEPVTSLNPESDPTVF